MEEEVNKSKKKEERKEGEGGEGGEVGWERWMSALPEPSLCRPFELVELPESFSELVMTHNTTNVASDRELTLCLFCGKTVMAGDGDVFKHSKICGGGLALFLFIPKAIVLGFNDACVYQLPSPYVDQFGETHSHKRDRPLYLKPDRYLHLQYSFFFYFLHIRTICAQHQIGVIDSLSLGSGKRW